MDPVIGTRVRQTNFYDFAFQIWSKPSSSSESWMEDCLLPLIKWRAWLEVPQCPLEKQECETRVLYPLLPPLSQVHLQPNDKPSSGPSLISLSFPDPAQDPAWTLHIALRSPCSGSPSTAPTPTPSHAPRHLMASRCLGWAVSGQFTRLPLRGGALPSQAGESGSRRSDRTSFAAEGGRVATLAQGGH